MQNPTDLMESLIDQLAGNIQKQSLPDTLTMEDMEQLLAEVKRLKAEDKVVTPI